MSIYGRKGHNSLHKDITRRIGCVSTFYVITYPSKTLNPKPDHVQLCSPLKTKFGLVETLQTELTSIKVESGDGPGF